MIGHKIKIFLALLIITSLVSGCSNVVEVADANTSKCIGEKASLYVKDGCPFCEKQKEMFGENVKYLNIIDCSLDPQKCINTNIVKVPSWFINEEIHEGFYTLKELKTIIDC